MIMSDERNHAKAKHPIIIIFATPIDSGTNMPIKTMLNHKPGIRTRP